METPLTFQEAASARNTKRIAAWEARILSLEEKLQQVEAFMEQVR